MSPALPFVRLLPRLPLVSSLEEMRDALITREHGVGVAGGNTAWAESGTETRVISSPLTLDMYEFVRPRKKRTRESLAAGGK